MADSVVSIAATVAFVFFVLGLFIGARLVRQYSSRDRAGNSNVEQFRSDIQLLRELVAVFRQTDGMDPSTNEGASEHDCTCNHGRPAASGSARK